VQNVDVGDNLKFVILNSCASGMAADDLTWQKAFGDNVVVETWMKNTNEWEALDFTTCVFA
jgi:hypothetical protein